MSTCFQALKEEWIQKKMNTFIEKYQKELFQVKFAVSRNPLVVLHFIFLFILLAQAHGSCHKGYSKNTRTQKMFRHNTSQSS